MRVARFQPQPAPFDEDLGQRRDILSLKDFSRDEFFRVFQVADDLAWELVLAEPDISQPVFLNFDERGRMWVAVWVRREPSGGGWWPGLGPAGWLWPAGSGLVGGGPALDQVGGCC
mgnify:CR=1 FL=1